MVIYERVAREVGPKRESLAEAQATLAEVLAKLAEKQAELKAVVDRVTELENGLKQAIANQQALADQVVDCQTKLVRAEKLIGGLGGEKGRWQVSSKRLGQAFVNLYYL
jgi:dynein heavy chain, axonemal